MKTEAVILEDDAEFRDGLENLIANMGTETDKRSHAQFVNSANLSLDGNQGQLNALYRTNWLAGKVVDIVPDDMTREWREFTGDMDPDTIKELKEEEDRLGLAAAFNEAHKWGRLYGTAFIIMSIDDGKQPHEPLDINSLKPNCFKHMKVVDRHRVNHADAQPIADPMNPNFGMPEFYRINETSIKIHHSRVIRFDGVKLPFDEFRRNNYFSDSVLDRLYDAILDFCTTTQASSSMVYETNVDIVKVKGLMSYLQTKEGEALLRKRFALAKMLKSFNNMMLLDSEESHETKTNTFAGLPELINKFALFLAAASDVPATRLLGSSASGLNATGEGDLKNYYDTIRSKQIKDYKPKLDYVDRIIAKSMGLADDADLSYTFNSLFQMTPEEISTIQLNNAQRDSVYLDRGVLTEEIVAKELKQNDTYTNITNEYIELLEEIDDMGDIDNGFNTDPGSAEPSIESEIEKGEEEETESDPDA